MKVSRKHSELSRRFQFNRRVTGRKARLFRKKVNMEDYICKKCGGKEFYLEKDGHRRCKACTREKMRKIYATEDYKIKHRISDRRRRRNYSNERYKEMAKKQNGRCAICGKEIWDKLRADHNHETGKPRGLLCDNCNWGLGNFKDSIELLNKSIEYLKRYEEE